MEVLLLVQRNEHQVMIIHFISETIDNSPSVFHCLSGIRLWGQHSSSVSPDFTLSCHNFQFLLGDSKVFPGQVGYIIPTVVLGLPQDLLLGEHAYEDDQEASCYGSSNLNTFMECDTNRPGIVQHIWEAVHLVCQLNIWVFVDLNYALCSTEHLSWNITV